MAGVDVEELIRKTKTGAAGQSQENPEKWHIQKSATTIRARGLRKAPRRDRSHALLVVVDFIKKEISEYFYRS